MVAAVVEHLGAVEITAALEAAWEFVRRLNRYVEEEAPWKLAKDPAQAERLDLVLHGLAAGLRLVALTLLPGHPRHGGRDPAPPGAASRRRRPGPRAGALERPGGGRRGRRAAAVPAHRRRGVGRAGVPSGDDHIERSGRRPTGAGRHPLPPRPAQGHARRSARRGARGRYRGRRGGRHRPALVAHGGRPGGAPRPTSTPSSESTLTTPWASTAWCAPASSGC